MSSIYVISDGHAYKIGVAVNVERRRRHLQTGSSRPLSIEFIHDTPHAKQAEADAHAALRAFAVVGEWFSCTRDEAINAVLKAVLAPRSVRPRGVRDLVLLWGESPQAAYTQLAADLGSEYREHMPRDWARRNRIPVEHIDPLVNAAQRRGFHDITHAFVVKMIREGVAA